MQTEKYSKEENIFLRAERKTQQKSHKKRLSEIYTALERTK
jgi:hypothetical protein